MKVSPLVKDKQIVIFELDDVLFPSKDYLLQVYYLFAQFIEYAQQKNAQSILDFMRSEYESSGTNKLFEKTAQKFELSDTYQHNFDLLHQTARLPLKLLLYNSMLKFLQELVVDRKQIYIVTSGNPEQQLNKIKQTEWNGLEKYLTVHGIEFINDSKATNINSAWYALESMTKPTIWLVGGIDKGNDYTELIDLVKSKVKAIVCIGVDNEKIIQAFSGVVSEIVETRSMDHAIKSAYFLAEQGDVVLLSPACASFDLFSNYEDRGRQLKKRSEIYNH